MENNNPCLFTIKQPLLQRIFPLIIHPPEIEYTLDGSEAEKQNGEKMNRTRDQIEATENQ